MVGEGRPRRTELRSGGIDPSCKESRASKALPALRVLRSGGGNPRFKRSIAGMVEPTHEKLLVSSELPR